MTATIDAAHLWVGAAIRNQDDTVELDELLKLDAAVHFVVAEPLLGPIDFGDRLGPDKINWVIVGGECGANARPTHPRWVIDIRDQCEAAGVAFFFKQWGEWAPGHALSDQGVMTEPTAERVRLVTPAPNEHGRKNIGRNVYRVGWKAAGRLLKKRTWDEFPKGVTG